jgi:predicted TIM-barrel enzyme
VAAIKKGAPDLPVLVGSGVTPENILRFQELGSDAVIVGSFFKKNGLWDQELDEKRISNLMNTMDMDMKSDTPPITK